MALSALIASGRLAKHTAAASLCPLTRAFAQEATGSPRLLGACLLERLPVVTPEDPEWEREYAAWQEELHARYRKKLPKEFQESELEADPTAQTWQPAPRVTEADRTRDTKSLQRALDRRLYLLLQRKDAGADGGNWCLPSSTHQEGETMRQAAERALESAVAGRAWKTYFLGNSPCAHWEAAAGTTFVHKAQLIKGEVGLQPGGEYADFSWLTREEVLETVEDPMQRELFSKLLPAV